MGTFFDHCVELEDEREKDGIKGFQPEADAVIRRRLLDAGIDPVEAEDVSDKIALGTLVAIGLPSNRESKLYHIIKGTWVDGVVTGATFEG